MPKTTTANAFVERTKAMQATAKTWLKINKLTDEQILLGSRFLTLSNLGQPTRFRDKQGLHQGWAYLQSCTDEEWEGVEAELAEWRKQLRRGDLYSVGILLTEAWYLFQETK